MRFISVYIPKVKSVYIVSKLVCILLAKWCVGIGDLFKEYRLIYTPVDSRIEKYNITAENMYN